MILGYPGVLLSPDVKISLPLDLFIQPFNLLCYVIPADFV